MKRSTLACALLAVLTVSSGPLYGDFLTFSNSNLISIPTRGPANPYSSAIDVSGLTSPLVNMTMTLGGFSHTYPDDTAAAVVSPQGTAVLLFSGPGTGIRASNITFVFDDNASATLPGEGALASGRYKPGLFQWDDVFPSPGPAMNYGFAFQPLLSENPNGTWNLFVMDDNAGDGGAINLGWSVTFEYNAVPEPNSFCLSALALVGMFFRKRVRV